MLRLYTMCTLATKVTVPRKRATKAAAAAALQRPALRRNAKRVHAALAETAIASVAQSLARAAPRRVLGLDINTNSTGYAVLDGDGRVVTWGQVSTAHVASSDVLAIAHVISEALRDVQAAAAGDDASEWLVGIEDFMRMYRFGQFHNKGIFQLAQLNGIVSYACWQRFGCRPVHTHPTAARALFGIVAGSASAQAKAKAKAKRKSSEASVKEQAMAFVLARERDSDAARVLRATHVNRLQQWTDAAYDIADAYVVADYTRWMALQGDLQQHPDLLRQFSTAYLSLALPAEVEEEGETTTTKKMKKQPTTVEATALRGMDTAAQHAYLSELFASGVADWVKQQQQPEEEEES